MVTFVFDSSAVMRYLDDKAGAGRVEEIIQAHSMEDANLLISAIQWGEIAKVIGKRHGNAAVPAALLRLADLGFEVLDITAAQAVRAATLQNYLKLSYADAFVLVLAQDQNFAILVTADFDFKAADHLVSIEFLPSNS